MPRAAEGEDQKPGCMMLIGVAPEGSKRPAVASKNSLLFMGTRSSTDQRPLSTTGGSLHSRQSGGNTRSVLVQFRKSGRMSKRFLADGTATLAIASSSGKAVSMTDPTWLLTNHMQPFGASTYNTPKTDEANHRASLGSRPARTHGGATGPGPGCSPGPSASARPGHATPFQPAAARCGFSGQWASILRYSRTTALRRSPL